MFKQYEKVYHDSYSDKRRIIEKRICKKGFVWVRLGRGTCWVLEKDCRRERMSDYKVKAWSWCADYCKKNHWNPHDSYFWDKAMLEYRRENNIFEVGDYIVRINNGGYSRLEIEVHQVEIAESERIKVFSQDKSHSYWVRIELFRLATTEEIQAGRRL